MNRFRIIPTLTIKYLLRFFYRFFCIVRHVDTNKVTFASYRSDRLQDNLLFIYYQMEKDHPELKKYVLLKKMDSSMTGKLSYVFHMIRASFHLATSRYFIIDDYYMPVYFIKPREGIEIIQLWHSAGALKKFGLSTVGAPFGPSRDYLKHVNVHGNYSKAYVSSSEVIPYFAEAFGMPESRIRPLGIPRTDYFYEQEKVEKVRQRFLKQYPELKDKKVILYAPTFRGKSHHQGMFTLPFDVTSMRKVLAHEYVLLIHLHPYMQGKLAMDEKLSDFAIHLFDSFSIQELLVVADLLITDYSTVFFDYCLLEKPIIFYPYDLKEYKAERDFYYDYEKLVPGPVVTTTESLINLILSHSFDTKKIAQFRDRFFDDQDGKASKRIVKDIVVTVPVTCRNVSKALWNH